MWFWESRTGPSESPCFLEGDHRLRVLYPGHRTTAANDHGSLQLRYVEKRTWVYYGNVQQLLRVPYDGSGPPEVVLDGGRRPPSRTSSGGPLAS